MHAQSIGINSDNIADLIGRIKEGLPMSSFEQLKKRLDVSEKILSSTIDIPKPTLTRRKREGKFSAHESDRLVRLARLYEKALDLFEDADTAVEWLKKPAMALGGATPLEYAYTELGAKEVEDLLGRIEHGVFS